ncbi:MAG TPA: BspA family leucine-rich repeat surface protein, partial [Anaerolineales bacterium]|nr:BspA family leucine-rich repeat surface protein [Anaerolineales bacterium]
MKQSIKNIKTFLHILFVCLCLGLLFDSEPARAAGAEDFIITVNTEHPGTSTNTQFTIPTYTGETYNYNVDCNNDGTNEITGATEDYTCDYTSLGGVGIYTIRISDNIGDRTGFPRISFVNKDAKKLLTIEHWGTGIWTSMVSAFQGCENLQLNATDVPDLSNVTDTTLMFADASSFNGEIDNWDVSNVTNMYMMFFGADAFNQPLDNWDTSKVIYMNW